MRKQFLGLAALSLLLVATSCINETTESPNGDKELKFRTALGKQTVTRATEFTNSSWTDGTHLVVYSYLTGSATAYNEFDLVYAAGTTSWSYTPPVMSTGVPLRYYSWYPATNATFVAAADVTATTLSFDYEVQAVNSQEDLIAAAVTTDQPDVTLGFKHILSQVNFGIVNTFGMAIEIDDESIMLTGVKDKGTYTFNGASSGWSDLDGATEYIYAPVSGKNKTTGTESTPITYMGNEGGSGYNANTNALMLMPQTFEAAADGTLSFKFFLITKDENGDDVRIPESDFETATVNLCDFDTTTWAPGKRYLYLFDFNSYLVTGEITFRVTVADWEDDDDNTVAETLQVADVSLQSIEAAIAKHSAANEAGKTASPAATLKTFPIAVPGDIEDMTLTLIQGFDTDDKIVIAFKDNANATKFDVDLDAGNWTAATDGRFVTLTCVAPINFVQAASATIAEADAGTTATGITGSILAYGIADSTNATLELYQIVVKGKFTDDIKIEAVTTFTIGDRIRIVCEDKTTADKIAFLNSPDSNWDMHHYDNVVLLIRK